MRQPVISLAALGAVAMSLSLTPAVSYAQAEAYPNRAVRLVVPFAPGGGTDVLARIVAERLANELGQPIVVDNRAGAGSQIGVDSVAKATPDGYTVLFGPADGLSILPALRPTVPYDSVKDFTAVARVATSPFVISINPAMKAATFEALMAEARARPGEIRYGTPGIGSIGHLAMEWLQSKTGTKLSHVPYKGGGPALVGFMSGDTEAIISSTKLVQNAVESGKARMLAQTAIVPQPDIPKVPTLDGLGLKDFEVVSWFGLLVPAGTPQPVVDRLDKAVANITRDPDFAKKMIESGSTAAYLPPKEFGAFIEQDRSRWMGVVKDAGIKIEP